MRRSGRRASALPSVGNDHLHPVLRPERDCRLRYDRMPGNELELPLLRERGDQKHQLHPRKRLTDALTWPTPEGEVGKTRQRCLELARPSVRFEPLGFHVIPWIAVHNPLTHDDEG